jgi:hypothetical protein
MPDETKELELPQEPQEPRAATIPPLVVHGEGYITRADGTVVHFTLSNEDQ